MNSIISNNSFPVVVSSHFKEDLDWIHGVKYPVTVFSKTEKEFNFIPFNKVQEVPAYVKYIIDNYNCLPLYSIFVHGHFESEHQDTNIVRKINSLKFNNDIINLNRPDWTAKISLGDDFSDKKYSWLSENWFDIFGEYIKLPDTLTFYSCAQFAVRRECILKHPIEFWQKIYYWCETNTLDNYVSSRIFEYVWYYIFSGENLYVKDVELST